jgi:hypothetical protein
LHALESTSLNTVFHFADPHSPRTTRRYLTYFLLGLNAYILTDDDPHNYFSIKPYMVEDLIVGHLTKIGINIVLGQEMVRPVSGVCLITRSFTITYMMPFAHMLMAAPY